MAKKQETKTVSPAKKFLDDKIKFMTTAEKAVIVIGVVAFLLGVWGLYTRLFVGEREVGYGSYIVWGLWVSMYLFLAGVAKYPVSCLMLSIPILENFEV